MASFVQPPVQNLETQHLWLEMTKKCSNAANPHIWKYQIANVWRLSLTNDQNYELIYKTVVKMIFFSVDGAFVCHICLQVPNN